MDARRKRHNQWMRLPNFDAMEERLLCTVNLIVPGTANPYLANPANISGPLDARDGTAPPSIDVTKDSLLVFNVTGGTTNYQNVRSDQPPDGGGLVPAYYGARGGISSWDLPIDMLAGVFLGSKIGAAPTPYSGDDSALDIAPTLGQVFPIGDGLTGNGSGLQQEFQVPTGATRLYLVDVDGFQWGNNGGSLKVTAKQAVDAQIGQSVANKALSVVNSYDARDVTYARGGDASRGGKTSDCTHYTSDVLSQSGISIPYTSTAQFATSTNYQLIPPNQAQAGDVMVQGSHAGIFMGTFDKKGRPIGAEMGDSGPSASALWGPGGWFSLPSTLKYYRPLQ